MYVYLMSEPGLFTVGFFDPNGKWHPDNDYRNREAAANRVAYLNGDRIDYGDDNGEMIMPEQPESDI